MSLQFADFDADGTTDIFTATYEGTAFVVRGSAEGWQQPEHVKDGKGRDIVLSLYYDTEQKAYRNADRSPAGSTNPEDHCVSALLLDWDQDGDHDLLLGAYEGGLYRQMNEGKPGSPAFTGVNQPLTAGGEPFHVPGGLTAARPVDWDGDGLVDLVCGGFRGGVWLYRNAGRPGAPSYEAPVSLVPQGENTTRGPHFPNDGCYADPVDYDGDGDLDLLVGGYAAWMPDTRPLTEDEQKRLVEVEAAIEAVQERTNAIFEAVEREAEALTDEAKRELYQRRMDTAEFKELGRQRTGLYEELAELKPSRRRDAGIWLYRRN